MTQRSPGLELIIAYKLSKGPLMLALALWLTLRPTGAYHAAHALAVQLADASAFWSRIGKWLLERLSSRALHAGTALAWLDGLGTIAEGVLLLSGKVWGEWIVVAGLSALLPFEVISLERHPTLLKLFVLAINAAIVAYLVWRRRRLAR